jgi:hypothetical protein
MIETKAVGPLGTGLWQAIKFLDLGEADIDDYGLSPATIIDHFR